MAVDGNAFNNLNGSEAFQYLHSVKVGCVLLHLDSLIYLKADVQSSQSVNNSAPNAWVLVTKTGDVYLYRRFAGSGRSCTHAAVVLWKVENAVKGRLMCRIAECRDKKQYWAAKKSEMCLSEDTAEIIYSNCPFVMEKD
ncbi:hypothetical protein F2P79_024453 [Pimephales promelas]|nr:hypothetical protein F2P79_024453 [Pimephales promelas]